MKSHAQSPKKAQLRHDLPDKIVCIHKAAQEVAFRQFARQFRTTDMVKINKTETVIPSY